MRVPMNHSSCFDDSVRMSLGGQAWTYWRPAARDIVELALVHGTEVGLPSHFHDEDQVTFVLRGQRRFVMGRASVSLGPGQGACIPAGTPHRSLPQPLGVLCVNVYLRCGEYDTDLLLEQMGDAWRLGVSPLDVLTGLVGMQRRDALDAHAGAPLVCSAAQSVEAAALAAGMSREGYSRAFRRRHGMPPQAFGMISRLNEARQLLRANVPLADAAAMTGFADQSHLGRCFRRAFGVTPGRYRIG